MNNTMKKVLTVILSVILWMVILLAALFTFTTLATRDTSKVANVAGYTPMIVQTDSMVPTFSTGDLILVKQCDPATLKEGDIVTFHTIIMNEYALNTHRIIKIDEENGMRSYTTMGDNNKGVADSHIIADGDIVGKYVGKISKLGSVMNFLSSSVGFLLIIVLPLLIFFVYQVYHLIMVGMNLKKSMAVEAALEQEKLISETRKQAEQETKSDDETERLRAELEEARRLKAEAEAALAEAKKAEKKEDEQA